ncbi:MAG: alpha/beta hydrolase [Bradyrhizobiaceae bacterium]|nr:alpha/beta hydrolase [Bradyrhizobiaceae bacterium]
MTKETASARRVTFAVEGSGRVSGLLRMPERAAACYVLAHGAGAGMTHPFMETIAAALAARRIATLRYQFPYMEQKSRRPDPPRIAESYVRAAVEEAAKLAPGLPLIAGGKSFGGRMTSQAQAHAPLPGVRGIAFLGFPLHPAGKPSDARGEHLTSVRVPMLFLQGTRDKLAELALLKPLCARLAKATLHIVDGADHSFHVLARSGRKDADVIDELTGAIAEWAARIT